MDILQCSGYTVDTAGSVTIWLAVSGSGFLLFYQRLRNYIKKLDVLIYNF
jgi:hypothetical protein